MRPLVISAREFREAARKGQAAGLAVQKDVHFEARAVDGARQVTFTISTPAIDREGDTIAIDGWDLEAYRKNPVVLWAHRYGEPPVGQAADIHIEGGALHSTVEFAPADVYPFAETIYQLVKGGFLRAASIGMLPKKWAWSEDPGRRLGIDFIEQELLEWSIVPVPANAEALADGKIAPDPARLAVDPVHFDIFRRRLELERLRM